LTDSAVESNRPLSEASQTNKIQTGLREHLNLGVMKAESQLNPAWQT